MFYNYYFLTKTYVVGTKTNIEIDRLVNVHIFSFKYLVYLEVIFTDRSKAVLRLWIIFVIYVSSCLFIAACGRLR